MRIGRFKIRDFSVAWWIITVSSVALLWAAVVALHGWAFGF